MPTYQALRKKYPLRELFFTPELAAEITLMPIEQLGVDAAILFSDITVVALAMGYTLDFCEGPVIQKGEHNEGLNALKPIEETIRLLKPRLKVPLIGFCGGPYTVLSYMGKDPALLKPITEATIAYVQMQVDAGVDVIQIFDSWANRMTEEEFSNYSKEYLQPIIDAAAVPVIVFMRQASARIPSLVALGPAGISFDWEKPLKNVRGEVPMAVQGNLNPDFLFQPLSDIKRETRALLQSMEGDRGFIANLGHGVKPGTPYDAVRCFVDTVKEW